MRAMKVEWRAPRSGPTETVGDRPREREVSRGRVLDVNRPIQVIRPPWRAHGGGDSHRGHSRCVVGEPRPRCRHGLVRLPGRLVGEILCGSWGRSRASELDAGEFVYGKRGVGCGPVEHRPAFDEPLQSGRSTAGRRFRPCGDSFVAPFRPTDRGVVRALARAASRPPHLARKARTVFAVRLQPDRKLVRCLSGMRNRRSDAAPGK